MKKNIYRLLVLVLLCSMQTYAQDLKSFQLPNGLSVFIWEDPKATDVYGMVACNVGSKDDPDNLTGLAHYLEHVMFKGTDKIGAFDWSKEEPLYRQIIEKYDLMAAEQDPVKKEALGKEINQLTTEAAKYSSTNEFSSLTEGMGGTGLNASTSYDMTIYYNTFPAGGIYKWLELNSERLINPVFRAFQTELETVFEEYNMYQNNQGAQTSRFLLETIFPGHPYSRPVIGYPEHLKNPQLSKLIEFYNTWYTPQNMALILVGNVKTNEVIGTIKEKFGRLQQRPLPEKKHYSKPEFKGRKEFSAKIGRLPEVILAYNTVNASGGAEERVALEICTSILSNSSRTGLLDKLSLDGDVISTWASSITFKDEGRIIVDAVPYYDVNQRRFNSNKSTEKMLLKEIEKLRKGEFEDWLVQSIKEQMVRIYDLSMESQEFKARALLDAFINEQSLDEVLNYKEMVASITQEKIKEVAKKYFSEDYYALFINQGKPDKKDKLEKPEYDPLQPSRDVKSDYAKLFELMPVKYMQPKFTDFNEVQVKSVNDRSKLYYTKNTENDVFTLHLKYGIGTEKQPTLAMATSLMNNAGIMGQLESQEVKQEFSNLGTTCSYYVDDNYLHVVMYGFETYLQESCNLLTRQILFPKLDEKQMDNQKGMLYQTRMLEKESSEELGDALFQYLLYQDKSKYIDRPNMDKVLFMTIGELTGDFQRATDYEAEIHYAGSLPFDQAYDILSKNLPLKVGEKASESPIVKDRVNYSENTVYFLPDRNAQQANVYFFIEGDEYSKENDAVRSAFNQYFSGSFNGLVLQEIREYRSMAYHAYGVKSIPPLAGKKDFFVGSIGTQGDKVAEALEVYVGLLQGMPLHPERIVNIKNYLKEAMLSSKPEFRDLSMAIQAWKLRGYEEDPAKQNLKLIDDLTFEEIVAFYNEQIKGRPIGIAVCGDPKQIDLKALEKYGKVVRLSTSKVFSDK